MWAPLVSPLLVCGFSLFCIGVLCLYSLRALYRVFNSAVLIAICVASISTFVSLYQRYRVDEVVDAELAVRNFVAQTCVRYLNLPGVCQYLL